MTQQEANKIVLGMGCHPYSRLAMIDALLEGEKIGKKEQQAIDDAELARLKKAWEKEAEVNHDAAMAYKQGYHDAIDKACEWLEGHAWIDGMEYRFDITDFRKAMEEQL